VEEEDIMSAFVTHKLADRDDFKKIMAESKASIQDKVQVLLNKMAAPSTVGPENSNHPVVASNNS
jgi:hypothetical protein